ncbi:hypothetical protein OROMI_034537 [Orobanche minor]
MIPAVSAAKPYNPFVHLRHSPHRSKVNGFSESTLDQVTVCNRSMSERSI